MYDGLCARPCFPLPACLARDVATIKSHASCVHASHACRTVIRSVFHFVNIGVSIMMAASAAFGLIDFANFENIVLSIYLM